MAGESTFQTAEGFFPSVCKYCGKKTVTTARGRKQPLCCADCRKITHRNQQKRRNAEKWEKEFPLAALKRKERREWMDLPAQRD